MEPDEIDLFTPIFPTEAIKMRQHFYFLGRDHELAGNTQAAIDAYQEYLRHLEEKDRHIPYLWISNLYFQLGDKKEALSFLERFAEGCKPARAEKIFKEIGGHYKKMGDSQNSGAAYQKAREVRSQLKED